MECNIPECDDYECNDDEYEIPLLVEIMTKTLKQRKQEESTWKKILNCFCRIFDTSVWFGRPRDNTFVLL